MCLCTRHVKFALTTLSKLPATGHSTQTKRREIDSDMRWCEEKTEGSHKRRLLSVRTYVYASTLSV